VAAVVALACAISGIAWVYFWQPCDEEDNIRAQAAAFRYGGFEGTDEYTAAPADNEDIQRGLPRIRVLRSAGSDEADSSVAGNPQWQTDGADLQPSEIQIRRWDVERMSATVHSDAGFAVLRLMDYPAWQVRVNGVPMNTRPRRGDGLMTIHIAAGTSEIEVRYRATRDVWLGRILSLLAAVIWIGLAALRRRQRIS
jgi:hypothetical protein